MKRGDIVVVSSQGDYGKPRPAVIVQSDALAAADSVLVSLLTSDMTEAPLYRLMLQPDAGNGLRAPSQVMVDKIVAIPRAKASAPIGSLDQAAMIALNQMLAVMIGIAD
ncbi:MAG: type II toxin-antitoxin system PemK/MazF family toxin [Rhodospirillales bacterium]|nr:type II toxin-antitoxin system PemK/MazF family toxin [Rhodospirillales bacterium]